MLTKHRTCPSMGYQTATVCVPVTVTPYVRAGATIVSCCGEPFVSAGDTVCAGDVNGACTFTLSQTICMAVPVEFGATAVVGDTSVVCGSASSDNICEDCDSTDE